MMEVCEYAISNAEAFAEKLSRELQVLDGVSRQRHGALGLLEGNIDLSCLTCTDYRPL